MNNYVRTSEFPPTIEAIPTPEPLALYQTPNWPFFSRGGSLPLDAGTYEFGESYVAEDGRYTAMGPTCLIQLKQNSSYGVRFFSDRLIRAVGRVLWCRRVDGTPGAFNFMDYEWRPAGGQPNCNNAQSTPKPHLPFVGWNDHVIQAQEIHRAVRMVTGQGWNTYDEFPRSPEPAPLYAPTIIPYHVPSVVLEVRIRYVGVDGGMSLPSDPVIIPAYFGIGDYCSPFELVKRARPVWGVKGYYIEMRRQGTGSWYLQKNPAQTDYLWDFSATHFVVKNFDESYALPITLDESPGVMKLSSLHRAIREDTRSIIVDTDQEIWAPVFNGVHNGAGTNAFERTICGENRLPFRLKPMNSPSDPNKRWPAFVEGSIGTTIDGMTIISDTSSVGIDFCAYNDSAAFRPRVSNYNIVLLGAGYRAGIRQMISSRAPVPVGNVAYNSDTHTCSEPIFTNGVIAAKFCYVIEGGQSANWVFMNTHFNSSNEADATIGSVNNSGQVRILGQTLAEGGRAWMAVLSARLIEVENFFSDNGMPCYYAVSNRAAPIIRMHMALANQRPVNDSGAPIDWVHLVESPVSGTESVEIHLTGRMDAQGVIINGYNVPVKASFYSSRYVGNRYFIDQHIKFGTLSCNQPDINWWSTALADFVNVQSYRQVWDGGLDAAQVIQPAAAYGLLP